MTSFLVNGIRELIALIPYSVVSVPCYRIFGRCLKVSLGSGVMIVGGAYLGPKVTVGNRVKIFRGTFISGGEMKTEIGEDSFVGRGVFIENSEDVIIGKHVAIAPGVHIFTHDSVLHWLSNYQVEKKNGRVSIGDNCYVGTGAFVLKGVSIGRNSVVGANSVVTKDVPESSVVIGSPAKLYCKTEELFVKAGLDPTQFLR
jgi:acetyltransferase-like isoleucine patch superfamily enzyme